MPRFALRVARFSVRMQWEAELWHWIGQIAQR